MSSLQASNNGRDGCIECKGGGGTLSSRSISIACQSSQSPAMIRKFTSERFDSKRLHIGGCCLEGLRFQVIELNQVNNIR
jgi:hypothetical protein